MRIRTFLTGLLASLVAAGFIVAGTTQAARADALSNIKQKGTLVVGVKADYPPFGFRGPSGNITGLGPDLAANVAKRLGVKVDLVPVTASNRMQFLQQGKIDLLIATLSDTPERERLIAIVKPPYYASGYNLMVRDSAGIKSWSDLSGKSVCGIQGTYYNKQVAEKYNAHVVAFTGTAEALSALKQGRCIGFLFDNTAIQGQLLSGQWSGYSMPLETQDAIPWGVGVKLGNTALYNFVAKTVEDWHKTGFIEQLETKYHIQPHSKLVEEMHDKYK